MLTAPVGKATPDTNDRSIFPGIGLICHFRAGVTSGNPDLPGPLTGARELGRSINISRHDAIPKRHRVFVPSMILTAVPTPEVHPVLALKAAKRNDQAGVCYIRPVSRDFVLRGWTSIGARIDRRKRRERRHQPYPERSSVHGTLQFTRFLSKAPHLDSVVSR